MEKARKMLNRRSSQEWKQAIDRIRCGHICRLIVAQIVWWDYFSKKPASPHDDTLDSYKADWDCMVIRRTPVRIRARSVAKALVSIGYQEDVAEKRSRVVK